MEVSLSKAPNVPGAQFMIQSRVPGASGTFLLHNVPGPYSYFSDMVDHIPDASLREVAQAQGCWMSIDLSHQSSAAEGSQIHRPRACAARAA